MKLNFNRTMSFACFLSGIMLLYKENPMAVNLFIFSSIFHIYYRLDAMDGKK